MGNPIKKLAGDTAIYGLGTMVPRLLNYLLVPFYTRLVFNTEEYGHITELYAYVAILLVLLTLGMETAFFRYANKNKNAIAVYNTSLSTISIVTVFFLLLIVLFLGDISSAIRYSGHSEYILLIALIVGIDAFTAIPFAWLRYENKAKRFSLIRILSVVINISFNLIFLIVIPKFFPEISENSVLYEAENKIIFVFIANIIGSASTLLLLWNEIKLFKFSIDKVLLRKLLAYGLPILVIGFAGMINEVADKILLKYFLSDQETAIEQVGIYGASYKLAILMMLFIQMFRYAAEPFFFAEAKKKNAKKTYGEVMNWFVIFIWFIFLGVNLYLDIFKYFIGEEFWAGLSVVPIILAAKMSLGVFFNLSVWYKLTNKTLYGALIAIFGALVTIVLNIILIPTMGYMGSAWANFICYFSMMLISFFWGRKVYKVNYNLKKIFTYSILGLLVYYASVYFGGHEKIIQLSINTALLLIFLGLIALSERRFLFRG
ncbi:MAG: polysaccharide biosynthesis protein [Marinilabiliales bacterium]|nr:MAG: polysaccharide biosynthesis protein [Marinilabiliales bacterium]